MKTKLLLGLFAASALSIGSALNPSSAKAAACPVASTQADFAAWRTTTGGNCSGTPNEYGVIVHKMGLCTNDPTPSSGSSADYSSCSLTFEDNSGGTAASFAAGGSISLPSSLSSRPDDGTYGYALILISSTFEIEATYGPLADGTTYYSTSTSVGNTGTPNTTGPATTEPITTSSFNPGVACDSQDTVGSSSGLLTGTLLNSSEERIPDSSSVTTCSGADYILGVVALSSPVTVDSTVTALDATFTVTNNGTTIVSDNGGTGIIFEPGPFNVVLSVVR